MRDTRVAAVQFEHIIGDKKANLTKVVNFVEQAAEQNVEIIAFPECCLTGYWGLRNFSREQLLELAEPVFDGDSSQQLLSLAKNHNMTIGAGLIEIANDGNLYNTYVVAMPDGQFARHRKLHCFINKHMSCGSEYTVFEDSHECRVGVLICYDNNIGENVRMTALKGAEILIAPHQTGATGDESPRTLMGLIDKALWENRRENPEAIEAEFKGPKGREWLMKWLLARAYDNGLFLVFSNGVGIDDNEVRTGNAMIIDCFGRVITETWKADDDMVVADLDARLQVDCTGITFIKARRPELYGLLAEPTGMEEDIRKLRMGD